MFFQGFREDKDVVKVYNDNTISNELFEDIIHHGLEGGRAVGEAKEHDERFEQSTVGSECGLPLVALLHADIVETPSNIQFREVLGSPEFGDQLWDEWQRVLVLHGHGVECTVILYQSERAVFLLNEEDRRCHWRLGGVDPTRLKVLLEKCV